MAGPQYPSSGPAAPDSSGQYAPAGSPPAPYAGYPPASARGPIGSQRKAGIVVLLSIVTVGIYYLYWLYKTHGEIKDYSGEGVGAVVGLVIGLVIGIVSIFLLPSEVKKVYDQEGRPSPVKGTTGFWCLIPLVGFIVWMFKVQGALNDFWASKGAPPA